MFIPLLTICFDQKLQKFFTDLANGQLRFYCNNQFAWRSCYLSWLSRRCRRGLRGGGGTPYASLIQIFSGGGLVEESILDQVWDSLEDTVGVVLDYSVTRIRENGKNFCLLRK